MLTLNSPATGIAAHIDANGDEASINVIRYLQDGRILTGADDKCLKLWLPEFDDLVFTMQGPKNHDVKCLHVSADESMVAVGYGSWGGVHLWELATGKCRWAYNNAMYIDDVGFSLDNLRIYAVSGGEYFEFDSTSGALLDRNGDENASVNLARFCLIHDLIITTAGKQLWACRWSDKQEVWRVNEAHENVINAIQISPDRQILATGDQRGRIKIWNLLDGAAGPDIEQPANLSQNPYSNRIYNLDFTHDTASVIALRDGDSTQIDILTIKTGKYTSNVAIPSELISAKCLAIASDDQQLIIGTPYGRVAIYDLEYQPQSLNHDTLFKAVLYSPIDDLFRRYSIHTIEGYEESDELQKMADSSKNAQQLFDIAQMLIDAYTQRSCQPILLIHYLYQRLKHLDMDLAMIIAVYAIPISIPSHGFLIHDRRGETASWGQAMVDDLSQYDISRFDENVRHSLINSYRHTTRVSGGTDLGLNCQQWAESLQAQLSESDRETI